MEDAPVIHTRNAARLVWYHQPNDVSLIVAQFIPHDSRFLFESLSHANPDTFNTEPACPRLPENRTSSGQREIDANQPMRTLRRAYKRNLRQDLGAMRTQW